MLSWMIEVAQSRTLVRRCGHYSKDFDITDLILIYVVISFVV